MKKEFTIIDTAKDKIIESRKGYIELLPDYLKLVVDYECEEIGEDEKIPAVRKSLFNNRIVDRLAIKEINLFITTDSGNWCVECNSCGEYQVTVQYKKYEDAKTLFKEIIAWRYPTNESH